MDIGGAILLVLVVTAGILALTTEILSTMQWRKIRENNAAMAEARASALATAFDLTGGTGSYRATGPNGDQLEIRTWKTPNFFLFEGRRLMDVQLKLKSLQVSGSSESAPEYRYRFGLRKLNVLRGQTVIGNPRNVLLDGVATVQELARIDMYLRTWREFYSRERHN